MRQEAVRQHRERLSAAASAVRQDKSKSKAKKKRRIKEKGGGSFNEYGSEEPGLMEQGFFAKDEPGFMGYDPSQGEGDF